MVRSFLYLTNKPHVSSEACMKPFHKALSYTEDVSFSPLPLLAESLLSGRVLNFLEYFSTSLEMAQFIKSLRHYDYVSVKPTLPSKGKKSYDYDTVFLSQGQREMDMPPWVVA